jgi:hypothetical protein
MSDIDEMIAQQTALAQKRRGKIHKPQEKKQENIETEVIEVLKEDAKYRK